MAEYKDPLSALGGTGEGKSRKNQKRKKKAESGGGFSSPVERLASGQVRKVSTPDSVRAGKYNRKTLVLFPSQIDIVSEVSDDCGVGIMAMYRWLSDQGLQNYEAGSRPTPPKPIEHEPHMGHWGGRD